GDVALDPFDQGAVVDRQVDGGQDVLGGLVGGARTGSDDVEIRLGGGDGLEIGLLQRTDLQRVSRNGVGQVGRGVGGGHAGNGNAQGGEVVERGPVGGEHFLRHAGDHR